MQRLKDTSHWLHLAEPDTASWVNVRQSRHNIYRFGVIRLSILWFRIFSISASPCPDFPRFLSCNLSIAIKMCSAIGRNIQVSKPAHSVLTLYDYLATVWWHFEEAIFIFFGLTFYRVQCSLGSAICNKECRFLQVVMMKTSRTKQRWLSKNIGCNCFLNWTPKRDSFPEALSQMCVLIAVHRTAAQMAVDPDGFPADFMTWDLNKVSERLSSALIGFFILFTGWKRALADCSEDMPWRALQVFCFFGLPLKDPDRTAGVFPDYNSSPAVFSVSVWRSATGLNRH